MSEKRLYGRQLVESELTLAEQDLALIKRPALILTKLFLVCQRCGQKTRLKDCRLPNGKHYCPHCLRFGRLTEGDVLCSLKEPNAFLPVTCGLLPKLSLWQEKCAQELVAALRPANRHLLWAVTGAGKTEMLYPLIAKALQNKLRICLATPRIDVCNELYPRLSKVFPEVESVLLYGASVQKYRYTQIVLCTVHQLFRFYRAFDLLILDETDAYPFIDNISLHYAVANACKQEATQIYLTATPDQKLRKAIQTKKIGLTYLPLRFHEQPLPSLQINYIKDLSQKLQRKRPFKQLVLPLKRWSKNNEPFLIFVPKLALLAPVLQLVQTLVPTLNGTTVHASDPLRLDKVRLLRQEKYRYLVTTTILERGVTLPKLNVMVFYAELFKETTLVQIAGRVGRSKKHPTGDVILLCQKHAEVIKRARWQIDHANKQAKKMLRYG